MNKNRKKLTLIAVSLTLVVILLIGGTVAWLSDSKNISNLIGIGTGSDGSALVKIALDEPEYVKQILGSYYGGGQVSADAATDPNTASSSGHTVTNPSVDKVVVSEKDDKGESTWVKGTKLDGTDVWELLSTKIYKLLPGAPLKKDPTVKVLGEEPVYLRMRAVFRDGNNALQLNSNAFTTPYVGVAPTGGGDYLELAPGADWTQGGTSGWYYYKLNTSGANPTQTAVSNTDAAVPVFKLTNGASMTVPGTWSQDDIDALMQETHGTLDIVVQVQAVQSSHFTLDTAANPWGNAVDGDIITFSIG